MTQCNIAILDKPKLDLPAPLVVALVSGLVNDLETLPPEKLQVTGNIRQKILNFEEVFSMFPGAKFGDMEECPLKHSFVEGIYVREIFIPKGFLIVGKIHKHRHPNFLVSGEASVITESGGYERLKGPLAMISPPGTKRLVYSHTDVVWITIHRTDLLDPDAALDELTAKTYEEYEDFRKRIEP